MLTETWKLHSHIGSTCTVSRNIDGRETVWTLRKGEKGWRVYQIKFSKLNMGCNFHLERTKTYDGQCQHFEGGCWDEQRHAHGIRLTDSRIDRTLRDYAEGRRV
jgi:hypothetical protein